MKKSIYWVLIMVVAFVSSCRKDDPQPASQTSSSASGNSTFSFIGNVDGSPIAIHAGTDSYFMSTSYALDNNGVYDFVGNLKAKACASGCGSSLKITIKDYRPLASLQTQIDSSIIASYYSYSSPSGTASQYSNLFVGGLNNGRSQSYTWDFGDGTTATQTSTFVEHKYVHPGVYEVSLTSVSDDGCTSTITNNVQFGQVGNSFNSRLGETVVGDSAIFISIPLGGTPPYTYSWDFGDGAFSTKNATTHGYSESGVYFVSLTITDFLGSSSVQHANVSIGNDACAAYIALPSPIEIDNPANLANVVVEWTDAEGVVWTSNSDRQPSSSSLFRITSVTDYINNGAGEPTKKVNAAFSCTVYNGVNSLDIVDGEVLFALAYKK